MFFDFINYAGITGTDLEGYLLHSASGYVCAVPPYFFDQVSFYLRKIERLIKYVDDMNLRDVLLENITSIWNTLCDAAAALETHQYEPVYALSFPYRDYWVPYEGTPILPRIGSEEIS